MKATIIFIEEPYHKGFNWQVNFGGKAKQWYKTEEEAKYAKEQWDEVEEYKLKIGMKG